MTKRTYIGVLTVALAVVLGVYMKTRSSSSIPSTNRYPVGNAASKRFWAPMYWSSIRPDLPSRLK